jgi:outer membrane usher protein
MRCALLLAAALIYYPALAVSSTEAPVADSHGPAIDRANDKNGRVKTGQAQGPQTLLLDVTINTQKLADVIRVEKLADGRLVLPVEAWREARLRPAGEKLALPGGSQGYALAAVQGLTFKLDSGRLALDIIAHPEAFEASAFDDGRDGEAPPNQAPPGFYVNYNFTGTRSADSSLSYGAFLEGVAFNRLGSLVINGVMRGDRDQRELIRADTYVQKDLPGAMETLVMGDAIGSGGA